MLNSKASFAFSLLVPAPMRISILAATLIAMTAGTIPSLRRQTPQNGAPEGRATRIVRSRPERSVRRP